MSKSAIVGSLLAGKDCGALTDVVSFRKATLNPSLSHPYIKTIVLTRVRASRKSTGWKFGAWRGTASGLGPDGYFRLREVDFFLRGTWTPDRRALERPIAIACLRDLTRCLPRL